MWSRFVVVAVTFLAMLVLALPQPARAEDDPTLIEDLKAGRISEPQALAMLRPMIGEAIKSCEVMALKRAVREHSALQRYILERDGRATITLTELSTAYEPLDRTCMSYSIASNVKNLATICELDKARAELERLKALAENYQRQHEQARGAGKFGAVDQNLAKGSAEASKTDYESARRAYNTARAECEKKPKEVKVGDASDAIPLPEGTPETQNACYEPAGGPLEDDCSDFAALIGTWSSARGGTIETYLEGDGTLSARIIATNPVMEKNGYTAGMQVLRGWKPKPATTTWLLSATDGEYFTAAQPDRKPNEQYGTPAWIKSGVVFLDVKKPDQLQIPATLENRLSGYEPWMRRGPPQKVDPPDAAEPTADERVTASRVDRQSGPSGG